ncbi:MAG TPA: response regulator [Bacteroidota bacterium]|nr:response regulator [Bacteroidota bacterium]
MSTNIRYESILESISGGFFAMNSAYEITYWNKAAEAGTGMSSADVLGHHVFEVFPNARGALLGEKYRLAMETRTFQSFETAYRDDRFEKWYDVRIYPAEEGLSVFFQDITEKKRDQRQKEIMVEISRAINAAKNVDDLCQRSAEVLAAFEEIPSHLVCIYLYDPRTNELRLVAPASLDIDFPAELVHQAVVADAPTCAARAAHTKEPVVSGRIDEGTVGTLLQGELEGLNLRSVIAVPFLVQQELHGVIEVVAIKDPAFARENLEILTVVANDIAIGLSRKRLMNDLRMKNLELESQTEKTLEASDTLKKFLAMFSHELRSPLNSIIGFSELLTGDMQDMPAERMQEFMNNIQTSGRHLQQILNDILDLSKIEAGQLDLHIASYPAAYFEETVSRVLAGSLSAKNVRCTWNLDPELDELVVDQTRFKQILINLVSNAIKFSRDGGEVIVTSHRVGNDMVFTVQDFGVGIRPEEIAGLFRPFRQAKSGKGKNQEGIGLGLAITKKLVELHGGTIWVESEWEKGTTFSFKIPLIVDATSERIMQAGMLLDALKRENWRKEGGEKPLALIVEDSPQAVELLRLTIESAGYRVEIARNGTDALDMAKRLHPHVITLDLILPGKDGWQVMKELKRHPLCKHIPIIIVSIIDEKNLGFSLGAVEYFVKPVNREDLVRALDRVHMLPSRDEKKPSVLVIDDDRAATDLVQVILENEGYRVSAAHDGADGVAMAVREHPDVVLLDLLKPEMSGFAVAQQLRQIPATRAIPIIVLTSMEVDDEVQQQLGNTVAGLMSTARFTKKDLLREITTIENARWP